MLPKVTRREAQIFEEYEAIRASGIANMCEYSVIMAVAIVSGFNALAALNSREYAKFLARYSTIKKAVDTGQVE